MGPTAMRDPRGHGRGVARALCLATLASLFVTMINTMTNTIIATVNVGKAPLDVAVSLDGTLAFVSNKDDGTVSVIDIGRQAAIHVTDPMPKSSPYGLAIRP